MKTLIVNKDGSLEIIDLKDYISDYYKFEDAVKVFEKLEQREIKKKGIIAFG